jgi:hypothetical protein
MVRDPEMMILRKNFGWSEKVLDTIFADSYKIRSIAQWK